MKPVLTQEEMCYYVSDSDIINFIKANSDMEWNNICKYVQQHNIVGMEYGPAFWDKDILTKPKSYNEHQVKWITAFFEAHPWIDKMFIVFDD